MDMQGFVFFLNTICCFATSKACAFNAYSVHSTLVNVPRMVNWINLVLKNSHKMKLKAREFRAVLLGFLDF